VDWLKAARQLRDDGAGGVLVTVIEVRGHAPREAGAKMVVGRDGAWGSVGGGNMEATAIARARELIDAAAAEPEILEMRLSPQARTEHGRQCCGGAVRLLLEPLPPRPVVAVFGAGHVGYELARILSRLPIRLLLTDSRAEQLDRARLADVIDGSADVSVRHALLGEQVLQRLPRGAHVVIMTHDHAEDFALCDAALRLAQPPGSIGLIGSAAKWARFRAMLAAAGHGPEEIGRVTCPIGQPGITGKDPAVIAVAVAAALLPALSAPQRAEAGADPGTGTRAGPGTGAGTGTGTRAGPGTGTRAGTGTGTRAGPGTGTRAGPGTGAGTGAASGPEADAVPGAAAAAITGAAVRR
jgi:xanthine dehydrogenase accessory factor